MTVMQVRPNYSIVYQFKPQLKVNDCHVEDKKSFLKFLRESANWKDGDYFLKCSKGTFAFFAVKERRVKLVKKSVKGKSYLCWDYFE